MVVSVFGGCYNKIPQTRSLTNSRNFFLTVLGAGSPRSACRHGQLRDLFPVADFLYPHLSKGSSVGYFPLMH